MYLLGREWRFGGDGLRAIPPALLLLSLAAPLLLSQTVTGCPHHRRSRSSRARMLALKYTF